MAAFSKHNSYVALERDWLLLLEPTNRVQLLTRHRALCYISNVIFMIGNTDLQQNNSEGETERLYLHRLILKHYRNDFSYLGKNRDDIYR